MCVSLTLRASHGFHTAQRICDKSDVSRAFNNSFPLTGPGVSLRCQWVVGNCRSQDRAEALCPPPWMIVIAVFVKSKHPDMSRPPNVTTNHQLHLNLCFDHCEQIFWGVSRSTPYDDGVDSQEKTFDWPVMGFFVGRPWTTTCYRDNQITPQIDR